MSEVTYRDQATVALDEIAVTADAVADEQHSAAKTARRLAACRRQGVTWSEIVDAGAIRDLLGALTHSAARIARAGAGLRSAVVRALAGEKLTTRQIGERFAISHQRVSSLLARDK